MIKSMNFDQESIPGWLWYLLTDLHSTRRKLTKPIERYGNTDECWPVSMLSAYLAQLQKENGDRLGYEPRVLAVSYNSKIQLSAKVGNVDTDDYLLSENLVQNLILDNQGVGQSLPIILVGHDLGGILLKQLILFA
ncbi:hypothetical protein Mapa_007478 [Marchantia paleacea]|nr:hypothetical protein Mapa_007478 [Marchantia paleacea]